jgi:hypothetical protein
MKRPESSMVWFRQRIPKDVLSKARGRTLSIPIGHQIVTTRVSYRAEAVKISLRSRDPSEAKIRHAAVAAYLEGFWESLRRGPTTLTHKQTVALAGELYRDWVDALENDPRSPQLWETAKRDAERCLDSYSNPPALVILRPPKTKYAGILENRFGGLADVILARRGLVIDEDSRERLLVQVAKAMLDAASRLHANAGGDYRPDTNRERFPAFESTQVEQPNKPRQLPSVSLNGLLEDWWAVSQKLGRSVRTYEGYGTTFRQFSAFVGHDDASKITTEDVRKFRDHRLEAGIKPKTVRENDLASLRSVLGWAVEEGRLAINAAASVRVRLERVEQKREKSFTAKEAAAILRATKGYQKGPREHQKIADAKRWSPWLCAYSGARIGEILHLRRQDIKHEADIH